MPLQASDGLLGFDGLPNSPKIQYTPLTIPILSKQKFVQIASGVDHVLALTAQGHVWVWGNGQQGQLGRKIIERRKVNGLKPERLALRKIKRIRLLWMGRGVFLLGDLIWIDRLGFVPFLLRVGMAKGRKKKRRTKTTKILSGNQQK
jgi:hypothetical protein